MSARRRLSRPVRVARARWRSRRTRVLHQREVARGRLLDARPDRTPIFILGAPRSGTTVLYQLLTDGLDVGWLANAHDAEPGDVSGIERRERPREVRRTSSYYSEHGATREPWEPSEAGPFWYRFVAREPHELTDEDVTERQVVELRAAIREFTDACGSPVVFKNVFNSLRVPLLARALPEARFIVIDRSLADIARSLLVGRLRRGDVHAWWSARPAGADAVATASPAEQVVWQAQRMMQVAHDELNRLAPDRHLTVTYDEVCRDPRGVVHTVATWLRHTGADIRERDAAQLPASFARGGGGDLPDEHAKRLADVLAARQVAT